MLLRGETLTREQAKLLNPVTLAFLGDAVYALYVRERLIKTSGGKVADFQRASSKILSAQAQSEFLNDLLPFFTEEETDVYHRGRNAKKGAKSKNASPADYNRSTGLEAVIGYLYAIGEIERIEELFSSLDEEKFKIIAKEGVFKPSH
jgi:ribonuclease-3 family protein